MMLPEIPPRSEAMQARALLWKQTNAAVAAGRFRQEDWDAHLAAETALAEKDPAIDLEAIFTLGSKLGFALPESAKLGGGDPRKDS
jgi:hypothetical protein